MPEIKMSATKQISKKICQILKTKHTLINQINRYVRKNNTCVFMRHVSN